MLVEKERIVLDRPTQQWANDLVSGTEVKLAPITPSIAVAATELGNFHGDPADRLIFASAAASRSVLISKDGLLHKAASQEGSTEVTW